MTRTSQPEISLIIPVYNEGSHILESLRKIEEEVIKATLSYEIIIVDDGSSDDTWAKLSENMGFFDNLIVLKFSRNFGKEAALVAGLEHAKGEAVIIMDADLQHPPSLIPEMVKIWRKEEKVGIVECVKKARGQENFRYRFGAKLFYGILKRFTGYDLKGASDFKLLDRKVVDSWKQMPEKDTFFRGMTAWLGFKKVKYEFDVAPRTNGDPKWSLIKLIKLALNGVVSFTSLPLRFVSIVGILFFIAAILLGIHTLYQKISGNALTGFTTVILLQLIIGSVVMISLGVVGEYISAIYKEVKGRPRYLIEDTLSTADMTYQPEKTETDYVEV